MAYMHKRVLHWVVAVVAVVCSATFVLHPAVSLATADESTVKAGYIYNFMKFVDWPPAYMSPAFNLCVLGDNPFGGVLQSLSGKMIQNRPIRVVTDVQLVQTKYCHVVFVSRSESGQLTNALLRLRMAPILTVSDIEGFADKGGVIELITGSAGDISFRVSQKSAQDVGLRVSSKLLSLSR